MAADTLTRRAPARLGPASLDPEARSALAVIVTEAGVRRFDQELGATVVEVLQLAGIDCPATVPLNVDHQFQSVRQQIGVAGEFKVRGRELHAVLRFDSDPAGDEALGKVQRGMWVNLSVAIDVIASRLDRNTDPPTRLVTRSRLMEVSLVNVPADHGARFLSFSPDGAIMDDTAAAGETANPSAAAAVAAAVAAERERVTTIMQVTRKLRLGETFSLRHIESGAGVDVVRAAACNEAAARQEAQPTSPVRAELVSSPDDPAVVARGMVNALAHKAAPSLVPLTGEGQRYVSHSLAEMAREHVERAENVSTRGWSDARVLERAHRGGGSGGGGWLTRAAATHTTSDFPSVYGAATEALVFASLERARSELVPAGSQILVPDLLEHRRVRLGEAPLLRKVPEGAEVTYSSTGQEYEFIKADSYAINFSFTREMKINDRLDMWGQWALNFGSGAAATEANLLAAIFINNPVLRDGMAVWHASRGNLLGAGSALSAASLGQARAVLRNIKAVDGMTPLNLAPANLIVPAALESLARTLMAAEYVSAPGAEPNTVRGMATVLVDARLDAASATAWWLLPNPGIAPVVELIHLDGSRPGATRPGAPIVETFEEADVLGTIMRCVYDVGAAAIGWRGIKATGEPADP